MLYPLAVILEELRQFLTLEDGDIIMTGTPAGVGPVQSGECFDGRVLAGEQMLAQAVWQAH